MFETFASFTPPCCCAGANSRAETATPPAPVNGRFELVDHFGSTVNEHSFGTRHLLVFFGFSHCAIVCPRELAKLSAALEMLGPLAERVQPLYISVDPQRDTPEVLRRYLLRYTGGFLGLTGSSQQVDAAKKSFRVFAQPVADTTAPDGYVVPHTAITYLMAPGGRYEDRVAESLDASSVAERLRTHLERTPHVA